MGWKSDLAMKWAGADITQHGSHRGRSFYTASLEHETYFVADESTVSRKEVSSLPWCLGSYNSESWPH